MLLPTSAATSQIVKSYWPPVRLTYSTVSIDSVYTAYHRSKRGTTNLQRRTCTLFMGGFKAKGLFDHITRRTSSTASFLLPLLSSLFLLSSLPSFKSIGPPQI